jgi:polyphosphate kinase
MKRKLPLINREISWLSFNERVLQEAQDITVPLIERIKFLAIFSSNLDEFYRVRVAALNRLNQITKAEKKLLGYSPSGLLRQIQEITIKQQVRFNEIYEKIIIPSLVDEKIFILNEKQLNVERGEFVKKYFHEKVLPALVPIMVDGLKDFPFLRDKSSYLLVKLSRKDNSLKPRMALIELPTQTVSRFLVLPDSGEMRFIIMLDDVVRYCLDELFSTFRYNVFDAFTIKLTRDAELDLDNDVNERYIDILSRSLKQRFKGNPVRFVFDKDILPDMLRYVVRKVGLKKPSLIPGARYHNFKDYFAFPKVGSPKLLYPPIIPLPSKDIPLGASFFSVLKQKDILLHIPYQSFDYVVQFLREAAIDPKVKTIKITLYRLAQNSRIINALINAAKNGKSVFVLVELKARFDEENNIFWSNRLEDEGVKVFTGFSKLKVHSKICLITRIEGKKENYYAHLSTGNYNENTAGIYCDQSFFTSDPRITSDLNNLFSELQEGNFGKSYLNLMVSPNDLRKKLMVLIDQEILFAKRGIKSEIIIKVNSLVDEIMINKLYEASNAGVKIRLIVRGICCLVPGIPGFSENIQAISIIDKFLEHSRTYWFSNNGKERLFLSSADLMTRNLDRRIEVAFPIFDPSLIKEVKHLLNLQLLDNTKARILDKDLNNHYQPGKDSKNHRSQNDIYTYLKNRVMPENESPLP